MRCSWICGAAILLACGLATRTTASPNAPLPPAGAQQEPANEPAELAPRHREWLEENVVYIISPLEKQAFLQLAGEESRDAFIEAFWRVRDPTPGTARNEARDEHERRLAHANRYLGAETPRAGWQTDRGRIYIQLGEPSDTLSYPDPRAFYPIELWFYRTDPRATGLPPFFYVMFFRPNQTGEYKLYDPVTDGPGSLAKDILLQMADSRQIVDRLLRTVGHEVALASVNLVPTERASFIDPVPSAGNALLFAAIEEAPLKGLDDRYAGDFSAGRGEVEASVVYTGMPLDVYAAAFWDERGLPYVHYGVEVPQERVLIGQYERDYYLSLSLGVDVTDPRGQTVVDGGDEIEQHFDEERAATIIRAPLAYYDRLDLVPGVYDLAVTLRNRVTDERALAETRLYVPLATDDDFALSDLLVASAAQSLDAASRAEGPRAFRFAGEQFVPAPSGRFPTEGTIEMFAQLIAPAALEAGTTVEASGTLLDESGDEVATAHAFPTAVVAPPAPTPLRVTLPLEGAPLGSYTVRLTAAVSSGARLSREATVEIVRVDSARSPEVLLAREATPADTEELRLRGWQHLRKGELVAAETYFTAGLESDPDNVALRRALAQIEVNLGKHGEAARILEPLVSRPGALRFDILMQSEALREAGAPGRAAVVARRALAEGPPTAAAYNALAEALLALGSPQEAIEAFEASLAIDPDQADVREKLTRIKGGLR